MLRSLAITGEAIGGTTRDTDQREERPATSDLRELVRGEKLDRLSAKARRRSVRPQGLASAFSRFGRLPQAAAGEKRGVHFLATT